MPLEPNERKLISKQKIQAKYDPDYQPESIEVDSPENEDESEQDDEESDKASIDNLKQRLKVC